MKSQNKSGQNRLTKYRIILASKSPARKKLLRELADEMNFDFECHTSDYEEDMGKFRDPKKLAIFLAAEKAKFIQHKFPESIIIGADTFGTIGRKIVGKPADMEQAKTMIRAMSENTVYVHTGLAAIKTGPDCATEKELISHCVTRLEFSKIPERHVKEIIKKDDVLNVAGALTIEGESGKYIETIEGDYHNVIGLPLFQLKEMLEEIA